MSSITQDAQRMSLLFNYGVVSGEEVVAWADSHIVKMDSPPGSLLELSTTAPNKTGDVLSLLHQLSAGADFWPAFRSALPRLHNYIVSHPDRAEAIANHLFLTVCSFGMSDVPEDLHFIYRFDDAFTLAREGTYGDFKTVHREFVEALEKFEGATS